MLARHAPCGHRCAGAGVHREGLAALQRGSACQGPGAALRDAGSPKPKARCCQLCLKFAPSPHAPLCLAGCTERQHRVHVHLCRSRPLAAGGPTLTPWDAAQSHTSVFLRAFPPLRLCPASAAALSPEHRSQQCPTPPCVSQVCPLRGQKCCARGAGPPRARAGTGWLVTCAR